jgi:hypothetical protein
MKNLSLDLEYPAFAWKESHDHAAGSAAAHIEHREIFHDEMLHLMRQIMKGEVSPVMTGRHSHRPARRRRKPSARSLPLPW